MKKTKGKMTLYEFFDTKKKWIKGVSAKDRKGRSVRPNSNRAVKWCIVGAILRLQMNAHDVANKLHLDCLMAWNDKSTLTFKQFRARLRNAKV